MAAAIVSVSSICLSPSSSTSSPAQEMQSVVSTRSLSFQGLRASKALQKPLPVAVLFQKPSLRKGVTISMSYEAGMGVMGTKVGMMTYFTDVGEAIPVTVIGFREGNVVTQVKTDLTDGYNSVQIGYRRVRDRKLTKPELGHLSKCGAVPLRHLQEFRLTSVDGFEPGQKLSIDELFKEGDLVDVSGNSIGKGFQGGIKRWNFRRGPMTHGSKSHRQLGSIGAGTTPGRVYPGKKMPGRMGGTKTKIRKLEVIKVDTELRTLIVKGAVPGKAGNLLRIAPAKIVGKNIPKS
ncbi:hypothetical protein GOP47_0002113 [Adiantum capillus-veneris]|uniref:Large ribosomal subunit protein uL3c n=1 Tax=Adiantum capillus-veneris TaxID=13818 RepID=A0A9D4VAB4_ADICA|nr:hypothetical protein GOP47_0002113 [Adiantum capillus-veneris]